MVATRSLADGSDRVAMIPGMAQATELSSATNARPSSPARAITRSIRNAARARYPVPSRMAISRNSSAICGTNTSTPPIPPITAWDRNDDSQPMCTCAATRSPSQPKMVST